MLESITLPKIHWPVEFRLDTTFKIVNVAVLRVFSRQLRTVNTFDFSPLARELDT